jgi:hypothetical protein
MGLVADELAVEGNAVFLPTAVYAVVRAPGSTMSVLLPRQHTHCIHIGEGTRWPEY